MRAYSVTPFVDIRIKQDVQFRLSLPIEQGTSVLTSDAVAIMPTFTVTGTVGSLK